MILGQGVESYTHPKQTHGRIDYMTLEMLEINREHGTVSELSLTMGVKSPKTKIKNRDKNASLIVDNNLDASNNIPNIEFASPALNNSNISQGDETNGGTISAL